MKNWKICLIIFWKIFLKISKKFVRNFFEKFSKFFEIFFWKKFFFWKFFEYFFLRFLLSLSFIVVIIIIHYYHYKVMSSLKHYWIFFFFFFFLKLLSCCVSHRVAFTQRESFKNYSPQSGTVILKLFTDNTAPSWLSCGQFGQLAGSLHWYRNLRKAPNCLPRPHDNKNSLSLHRVYEFEIFRKMSRKWWTCLHRPSINHHPRHPPPPPQTLPRNRLPVQVSDSRGENRRWRMQCAMISL